MLVRVHTSNPLSSQRKKIPFFFVPLIFEFKKKEKRGFTLHPNFRFLSFPRVLNKHPIPLQSLCPISRKTSEAFFFFFFPHGIHKSIFSSTFFFFSPPTNTLLPLCLPPAPQIIKLNKINVSSHSFLPTK